MCVGYATTIDAHYYYGVIVLLLFFFFIYSDRNSFNSRVCGIPNVLEPPPLLGSCSSNNNNTSVGGFISLSPLGLCSRPGRPPPPLQFVRTPHTHRRLTYTSTRHHRRLVHAFVPRGNGSACIVLTIGRVNNSMHSDRQYTPRHPVQQ